MNLHKNPGLISNNRFRHFDMPACSLDPPSHFIVNFELKIVIILLSENRRGDGTTSSTTHGRLFCIINLYHIMTFN